ncbi:MULTISPECIES: hypothetical protein [Pseudanabaena]|uniref:Uncharacterized protein n=2 Tax=Pseudanabaena TaxID=1152 RepID=L8N6W3_9CYAN|nr:MULTISPECIES: hypothetical protein [Pseudanabaena]ELS34844.1 hypothetical protein Pse7429DRAFT_0033 [Pseudanabaena biceps PCC 7429]MDG3492966.1 hypothetical protein [Pseudanabaena catenata USMAC16]
MILGQLWDSKQTKLGLTSNQSKISLAKAIANSQKIPEHHPHDEQPNNLCQPTIENIA